MKALILGGTSFLGRHVGEALLARGHEVTAFHRGLSNPGALPGAEHLRGDREGDLAPLAGRTWDVVIDPSGYEVGPVRRAARAVAHAGVHYLFVSSVSVYADFARMTEEGPVRTLANGDAETARLSLENYGALKAACERALTDELGDRVLSVRAGLILGPHDYDERFRWWLHRIARGGEVLAPGEPEALVQAIDARDLAAWIVHCAEARTVGTFNATSEPMPMRTLLETMRGVTGGDARFTWVPDEILALHEVGPYSEMPFWLPRSLGAVPIDVRRALAAGLRFRPLVDTVRDTWSWLANGWAEDANVRANRRFRVPAGLSAERERQLLGAARAKVE